MSIATITAAARSMLRDFPKYFEIETGPLNVLTIRLPHPLIMGASVQVFVATPGDLPTDPYTSTATNAWQLDDRNGLLKLTDEALLNQRVLVSAYHYTWFSDSDLTMAANMAASETVYNTNGDVEDIEGIYAEVTAMSAVIRALWSLATELSLDIDVSTPEGMYIPARQRYAQVMQMMQYWEGEYTQRAEALNIGLGALEQFTLRRVAKLTNRYVPVYLPREVDDPRWPKRIYPPIPDNSMGTPAKAGDMDVIDVVENASPQEIYHGGQDIGWVSIGTRGDTEWITP
jgi:hypothetical protein